jgi:HSP20 family protein
VVAPRRIAATRIPDPANVGRREVVPGSPAFFPEVVLAASRVEPSVRRGDVDVAVRPLRRCRAVPSTDRSRKGERAMLPTLVREIERFPLAGLRSEIDRLFEDFFTNGNGHGMPERRFGSAARFVPAVDVKETDTNLVIEVEVPGLKSNEVDVQIEDGILVLRGERKLEKEEKTKRWHRSERYWGKFERRLLLPDYVDAGKVDATCKDGVLFVTLAKKAGLKPKAVNVPVK